MKKYWMLLSLVLIMSVNHIAAQDRSLPFFDKKGNVAIQTEQIDALADTIAIINHRWDDIVWSRIVYRVIDMRDKQNNQLYFPIVPNEKYKSLFRLILESSLSDTNPLPAYEKIESDVQPDYRKQILIDSLKNYYVSCDWDSANTTVRKSYLIEKDPVTNQNVISSYNYEDFASKQMKFVIQEIVFFNKHYSRMYTKIIGIAPIFIYNESNVTRQNLLGRTKSGDAIWNFLQSSVLCWYLFDELRPYLAKQYVVPSGNDSQRMTYDEFFAQQLYSSYLLGDSNVFNRMLLQAYNTHDQIVKEQKRIETELLNVEQDLWEY
ncbi:MAG: gliding motility associated protein GldN [Bacteroidetes bacterium]|jgi:gliding motility associated protien GldN|nr:gliding motility associated protein GldN [Bacteroidota bacterium]